MTQLSSAPSALRQPPGSAAATPVRATPAVWIWAVVGVLGVVVALAANGPTPLKVGVLGVFGILVLGLCLAYEEIAWAALVFALSANGIKFSVAGLTLMPEHLAILLVAVHLLLTHSRAQGTRLAIGKTIGVGFGLLVVWWVMSFAISLLAALNPTQSIRLLVWVAANIVAAVLVCALRLPARALVRIGVATATVSAAIQLLGWLASSKSGALSLFTEQDYASGQFRLQGLGTEPNIAAAYLVAWLCVAYAASHFLPELLVWAYAALSGIAVYLTYTRVAWLMFAIVVILLALKRLRRNRFFPVFVVVAIAIGVFGVAQLLSLSSTAGSGAAALLARLHSLQNLDSGTGALRVSTALVAVQDLNASHAWLTGFGYNAYPQQHTTGVTSYATPYLGLLWLAVFYDSGILGGIPFIVGFLLLWAGTRRVGSTWFFISFALASTTTNVVWFAFAWVIGALFVRLSARSEDEAEHVSDAARLRAG
ncbi:hypothetical protein [Gryllotalpicola koreensis]|uniref:O-antigen ligase domain-containing protein n=1 Tax=Gryllotalpicola koreensis TaxID=993086 RepID=A0ABP8A0C7_9MICO